MESFAKLIDAFGGPLSFGGLLGIPDSHARTMKARDSVPVEYWEPLVQAASERGLDGVTYEALAKLAAARRSRSTQDAAA